MTAVQITISDALAKEAAAEGLLEPGAFEAEIKAYRAERRSAAGA